MASSRRTRVPYAHQKGYIVEELVPLLANLSDNDFAGVFKLLRRSGAGGHLGTSVGICRTRWGEAGPPKSQVSEGPADLGACR